MKIGILQYDVAYKDINLNLKLIKDYIENGDAELYITPELALTGYLFRNKEELAILIKNSEEAISDLTLLCIKKISMIIGHATEVNGNIYNTAFVLGKEGLAGVYNKIHLSKLEKKIFSEGNDIPVFTIDGIRIGINICYDLWHCELSRILFRKNVQLICCPCNFGGIWTLEIAKTRSLENKIFYAIANRTGNENIGLIDAHFRGESKIIDYSGNTILEFDDKPGIKTCVINPDEVLKKDTIMSDDISIDAMRYNVNLI
jgi:predicted amidohydrolase